MRKTSVLVTGCGSCGVGEGIYKCLAHFSNLYEIHASNIDPASISLFRAAKGHLLPNACDPEYILAVQQLCEAEGIEFVIPGSEAELLVLAKHANDLASLGVCILCNPLDTIEIGNDKLVSAEFLQNHGIATPISFGSLSDDVGNQLGFPLIAKPRKGHGSKNIFVVHSIEELELIRNIYEYYGLDGMLQEYIGDADNEFTASALLTLKGEIIGSFATRRTLIGGATCTVEVGDFPEVRQTAEKIAQLVGARGPLNIQCRIHQGKVYVFEINPRFSGSAPFRALAGFNEPHLLLQATLKGTTGLNINIKTGIFGVRGFEEIIVEYARVKSLGRWPR